MIMLKRIFLFSLFLLTIYSIYYDLNNGTLPINHVTSANEIEVKKVNKPNFAEISVEAGYTVLSIVEQIHQPDTVNASITQIINDFEMLNPNVNAHEIQIGQAYYFPIYE